MEINVDFSIDRNAPYIKSPIKIVRDSLCTKVNNDYRKYVMNDMHTKSNMPWTDDEGEDLCTKYEKVWGTLKLRLIIQ